MDRGAWLDPRKTDTPLAEWAETFMSLGRTLSPTTQQTYRRDLDRYVLPRFGSYRLGRIPPEEIEQWLNDELADGLAASSVHRHYRTLRRVLQTAVEKDRLLANPCDRARPPKVSIADESNAGSGAGCRPARPLRPSSCAPPLIGGHGLL